jgi:undecaprenyl-diphosphatase
MSNRTNAGLLGRLRRQDMRALDYVVLLRRPRIDRFMRRVTRLGDPPVVVLVAAGLLLSPDPAWRGVGVTAAVALVVSHLLVQVLKRCVSRTRPSLPVGTAWLIQPPDRFSFPSGHAAASLALALAVVPALPAPAGLLVLAVALVVGISRCYLGVHYPGDVLAGWVLAGIGLLAALPL